jgi:RHS repeat-associated protein
MRIMKKRHIVATLVSLKLLVLLSCTNLLASSQPYLTDHEINFGTGNKYHVATDLNLDSPVNPIVFKRTYNSQSESQGILGYGWTTSFGENLDLSSLPDKIVLIQSGGRHVHYINNGSGAWENETGITSTITLVSGNYELTEPDGTTYSFNSSGQLLQKQELHGYTITYSYDASSRLSNISDSIGRSVDLAYNLTSGLLETVSTQIDAYTTLEYTYSYDANNNLQYVTNPDSSVIEYIYDDPNDAHNLTGIIDEEDIRILTVAYDEFDRATISSKADGKEQVTINYLPDFQREIIRKFSDTRSVTSTYQLESKNGIVLVTSYTGPGCSSCGGDTGSSYLYDDRNRIIQVTDANGIVTKYQYNTDEKIKIEAFGTLDERTTTWTYEPGTSRIATITRESVSNPGQETVTTMGYDASGNLVTKLEEGFDGSLPISRTTTYTYDTYGRIATIDGPRTDVNDVTTYTYYADTPDQGFNRAQLYSISNVAGNTTFSNYNVFGKPESITTPIYPMTITYDSLGRLASEDIYKYSRDYTYFDNGLIERIDMPEGRYVTYTYTSTGKLETITDVMGNSIVYEYDDAGNVTKKEIHDPGGDLEYFISFTYEDTGKLDHIIQADGTYEDLDYDPVGNLRFKTDALANITEYSYDSLDRQTDIIQPGTVITSTAYDKHDNIISATDAENKTTTFTYDDFGRRTSRMSPDTGLTLYDYDESDNLVSKTDSNGITVSYGYDAANRLTGVLYPDSTLDVYYEYLSGNLLKTVEDRSGRTEYRYKEGLLEEQRKRFQDGATITDDFTIVYRYNENREINQVEYKALGKRIYYDRNATGKVNKIYVDPDQVIIADNIEYKPFGPLQSLTLGNGITITDSYNQLYRLTNSTAGSIYDRDYQYYPTGHVQTITDNINPSASQNFTYDNLGRLETAQGIYGSYAWSYDDVGNRMSEILDSATTSYSYVPGTNQLNQVQGTATTDYLYDYVGNMTNMGDTVLNWDQNNHLQSAVENGITLGEYGYDDNNKRTISKVNGQRLFFNYDQAGNLLQEIGGIRRSDVVSEYIYLDGIRLAQIVGGDKNPVYYYYISDHLNTGQLVTDDQGAVVWQGNFTPFGEVDVVVNNVENNFRFPGQYFDAETGLHYNWNRYYDPATGRYITADPIGLEGGMNLYAYVGGNPVNYIDPSGLSGEIPAGLTGEISSIFLEDIITGTIGELTGAVCATIYCKRRSSPSKNSARAECFRIFSKHNIPPGSPSDSYAFVGDCADKCVKMTSTKKFKDYCGCK